MTGPPASGRLALPGPRPRRLPGNAGDLVAGLSVALVLIPQSLAYASLAGLPPERGLYAAALTPLAAAIFASSRYLQTGPTAATSLLTLGALAAIAQPGSVEYVGLAALLALVVGAARVALGLVRAGSIAYLMSQPVLLGFTSAAAILIICSQVPAALGVRADGQNPIVAAAVALKEPSAWQGGAIGLTVLSLAIVVGARRIHPLIPGALLAVLVGIAASVATGYGGVTVGPILSAIPPFSLDVPWEAAPGLLVPGIVIALVGFAEPAAIARRYATAERQAWDPNREFVSQGVASLVAGVSGGFPVGGSFSRTALGKLAGARSRWSAAVTTLVVLASLPVMFALRPLPTAVLAAIVIAAVASFVDPRTLREYWRLSRPQALVALATFVATLALAPNVERGVMVGIGAAIAAHLWREQRLSVRAWLEDETLHVRPSGVLYFASAPALEDLAANWLSTYREARRLVVHVDSLGRIDLTGAIALRELLADARQAGLDVAVEDVPSHALRIVTRVLGDTFPVAAISDVEPPAGGGQPSPSQGPPED